MNYQLKKIVHFDINTGLKNNIGKVSQDIIISDNKTGFLSFGPYKEIPAGKYKFDLIYSSSLGLDEASNFWDINLIVKKNHTIIQKGDLTGTNSEFKTLGAQFETKEKAEVEIRSFYNGKGELKIKELVLYKIDQQFQNSQTFLGIRGYFYLRNSRFCQKFQNFYQSMRPRRSIFEPHFSAIRQSSLIPIEQIFAPYFCRLSKTL